MSHAVALCLALLCAAPAMAQNVQLAGILGGKALLVTAAGAPQAVAVGQTLDGMRVLAVGRDEVTLEIDGQRQVLHLGGAPVSVGARSGPRTSLVLYANAGGHFVDSGSINGHPVQFIVDTGATAVSIGRAEAERLGVKLQQGKPVRMQTANGTAQGWLVTLASVRIGPLEQRDVQAIVTQEPMPYVLLGNSFLQPYEMTRKGGELTLQSR
ncbi:MAG: retropepsin-like aspartic protease [Comamonas sp.]